MSRTGRPLSGTVDLTVFLARHADRVGEEGAVMTTTLSDMTAKKKPELSAGEIAAKEQGLSLAGPDGLLKQFTKTVLETAQLPGVDGAGADCRCLQHRVRATAHDSTDGRRGLLRNRRWCDVPDRHWGVQTGRCTAHCCLTRARGCDLWILGGGRPFVGTARLCHSTDAGFSNGTTRWSRGRHLVAELRAS